MGVGRRALWLGLSQVVELGLQLILPVVLVRHLDTAAFGNYRFLWLLTSAAASLLPMGMLDVLAVVLPRATREDRRAFVAVTYLYMAGIGLLSATLVGGGLALFAADPMLHRLVPVSAVFTALWVMGVMMDYLPVADERGDWQARAAIGVALLRSLLAAGAAALYGQVEPVFWMLAAAAGARVLLLLWYAHRHHSLGRVWPATSHWRHQTGLALPYGLSSLLFSARRQADQWIAAFLFGTTQLAMFSLGAVFGPLVLMVRRVVSSTLMPTMTKMEASGDWHAVIDTNNRANLAVAFFAAPGLAFLWCFGEPLYTLVYTSAYLQAVPVMRVLTVTWVLQIVELNSLVMLAGQMPYTARISLPLLLASAALSFTGGHFFGLSGAAAGGVLIAFLERSLIVRRLGQTLSLPIRQLQAWGSLLSLLAVAWSLAAAGRLAYEWRPAGVPPILGMLAVAVLLAPPYLLIAWRAGWLPHKQMAIPTTKENA
jgi:O-antigen/teichoic acid export membrane protein